MPIYKLAYTVPHEDSTIVEFSSRKEIKDWLEKYPSVYDFDLNNVTVWLATPEISPHDIINEVKSSDVDMLDKLELVRESLTNGVITEDTVEDLIAMLNPIAETLEGKYLIAERAFK